MNRNTDTIKTYILVDEAAFAVDTEEEIDAANDALRDAGMSEAPVWAGHPDDPDSYRNGQIVHLTINGLTAVDTSDGWSVEDSDGGRWWPDSTAIAEIVAAPDPAAVAIAICSEQPARGTWHS